ncbi:hypothetical protein EOD42_14155 [Rhodovarius crocodyli]|uniref:Phage tail protein n=1 Tax=Rhodovarius crocodyli TaxID=1979269 RepID=A0A437MF10_9PROT|nr:phage tail protein [Rhodovarius crocodyli]RVT96251.1 hypothetical protein EOD42_14155 [Rhodovarius crocodyli]
MTVNIGPVTIYPDGTATWSGATPSYIGTQPVWQPPRSPDAPVEGDEAPELVKHRFNDGYVMRSPKGLNHVTMNVNLSFSNIYAAEKDAILGFLRGRGGYQPFWWQQPNELMRRWICERWAGRQLGPDRWQVTAALTRDWSPS